MYTLFRSESFQQNERLFRVSSSKITHIIHPGDKINVKEEVGMCENFLYARQMFDFIQDLATNTPNTYFPFFSTVSGGEHMDSNGP